ncbi:MAG: LysM peptidoglycan-binding domain-containing protein, partial [Isosphaeraceae bacterium]
SSRPATDQHPAANQGGAASPKAARVEPALHTVTRGENFWTISRLYYGSGRYYKALWKANAQQYPDINDLHIDDVILIPAPEDLDAALIAPSSRSVSTSSAGRGRGRDRDHSPAAANLARANPPTAARRTRTTDPADASNPGRPRQAEDEPELDLPISVGDEETNGGNDATTGRGPSRLDDVGETLPTSATAARLTARPRPSSSLTARPVYKVRRYDTLRSIARDVLGDPHRADELYELNRDVISDPARLAVGQLLDLPDDVDTRRLSARDRSRGLD